ncbi:MAG: hypothetical protein RL754_1170 [Bacteroidota bacterium]|jgi:pimeloyl-ACP methyl ester carboxylesterase
MRKNRVWVLPGMGADSRIFKSIQFPWDATYLEWIMPEEKESIASYSERLLSHHPISKDDLIFGYSLGGIVAQDWASRHEVKKVVLLNSLHYSVPLRAQYRRLAAMGVLNWTPDESIRRLIFFMARLNTEGSRNFELVLEMMEQFPPEYYHWVLEAVLQWDAPTPKCEVISIGGSADLVFPESNIPQPHYVLEGATHLSFLSHGKEISALLKEKVDSVL